MRETPIQFGNGRALVGILSEPEARERHRPLPGVVFPNAGLIHRVGANRLHVTLARQLAAKGIASLRFDLSGIGDSPPAREASGIFERRVAETRAAMNTLAEATGTERFLLFGHCSGAVVSFLTARADPRAVGVGLLNPPGKLLLRHFLRTFLRHPAAWRRLFVGEATITRQLRRLLRDSRAGTQPQGNGASPAADVLTGLRSLADQGTNVLLVYSEWDTGYDYYHHALRRAIDAPELKAKIRAAVIPGADHNVSLLAHQQQVVEIVGEWMEGMGEARAA